MFSENANLQATKLLSSYPKKVHALLPMLHLAQREHGGFLTEESMQYVADLCETTITHVRGVATFYTMFKFSPPGQYHLQICTNISCSLCDGNTILHHAEKRLGIHSGETSQDSQFSIEEVECLGACAYAPAIAVNEKYYGNMTTERLDQLLDELAQDFEQVTVEDLDLSSQKKDDFSLQMPVTLQTSLANPYR